ncbi:jasmonate O-methyltransferase [Punica granatum]|uniref:Jasmonate O-methyltransferase-like n=2 Tax=Punica granatum TaxID=22663 RepID=A0A218X903_PUNGR|nr:jasmonate O-methyltransferase [Punica granatum]OWM80862.1 hypothetical protein CDL15_Pgr006893 [Punica granatum]PKI35159.1 hypothetical protein CRG98_044434 [Punica granatum]
MGVLEILHMNKGVGETSYAMNCTVQSEIIATAKPIVEEAILKILCTNIPSSLGIADLGCSSGPNTLSLISQIIDIVHGKCNDLGCRSPELRVSLNDLPSNDFNNIFSSLPEFCRKLRVKKGAGFGPCFISGVPGSFYGRLFPSRSMDFMHASSSLHWLSQAPPGLESKDGLTMNKGKVYISKSSLSNVFEAYLEQFRKDMRLFLESRSEEMVAGGRMVLSLMGRSSFDPTTESANLWELLSQALVSLVNEGLVEEGKVDLFNVPYYAPSIDELALEIQSQGSFMIDRMESFRNGWDGGFKDVHGMSHGERVGKMVRAVTESMLASHFGRHVMDDLFDRYEKLIEDWYSNKNKTENLCVVVSLIRKD